MTATPPLPATAQTVLQAFRAHHGRPATVLARAPGRVNLIGEHTDYNEGHVLPMAIDRDTWVAAAPRGDGEVRALALDWHGESDEFTLQAEPPHHPQAGWRDHVRGTLAQLHAAAPLPGGLDLAIAGDVPQGAGLSSSASLALALLRAAQGAHGLQAPPAKALALLAQRAENLFVGCQCGNMDQLASACGEAGHALHIDCRSLDCEPVPIPAGTVVLIAHSRVRRGLVDSAYNERRRQCEAAARALGVRALRDVDPGQLARHRAALPALEYRRARHIVTENERVLQAVAALRGGDLGTVGRLMAESHASMRDDFEITVPAVDRLAELLQGVAGREGGARMTGGGFGGCVVALLPEPRVADAVAVLARDYRSPEGTPADVYLCRPATGAAWFGLPPAG
ncbi:MAG: galactokinase [Burkholderiaceae bacterium]